jgi:predicted PurR-regulated permease PerM
MKENEMLERDYMEAFSKKRILFITVFFVCAWLLAPLAFPILGGIIVAYLSEDYVQRLRVKTKKKSKIWHWIFAILFLMFVTCVMILPLFLIILDGTTNLLDFIQSGHNPFSDFESFILQIQDGFQDLLDKFGIAYLGTDIVKGLKSFVVEGSSSLVQNAGSILYATPAIIMKTLVLLITAVIFIVEGKNYRNRIIPLLIPWKYLEDILCRSTANVLKALIMANLMVGAIQALLITFCFAVMSIPKYATLGALSFFMSFIPVVGTAPIMILTSLYCYLIQDRILAAIFIIIFAFIVGFLDNFLRPYLMKGKSELNFFWIFLAIFSGLFQFGVIGTIIVPIAFTIFYSCLKDMDPTSEKLEVQ